MPTILDRYIFKEIAVPFLLSLSILTATALLSKSVKLIELVATHGMGASFIFMFMVSVVPSFLIYTMPIAFLIGVLVAFTRLSSDSEITAMKASGLGLFTLARPVLFLALVVYAATLAVTLYLFPWGNLGIKKLLFDAARARLVSGIEEKTFYDRFEGVVLYVDRINTDTGEMEGIFISEEGEKGGANIFFAGRGLFSEATEKSTVYLKLYDGTIHRKSGKDATYHIADFSSYLLELGINGGPGAEANRPNRELYVGELYKKIGAVEAGGGDAGPYIIDLHKRFALPVSVFVFALMGMPLGIQKVRSARFTGFSVALGVVLVYYVLSTAFEAIGENGLANPVLSVWASDILMTLSGAYIFYRTAKDEPVAPAFLSQRSSNARGGRP